MGGSRGEVGEEQLSSLNSSCHWSDSCLSATCFALGVVNVWLDLSGVRMSGSLKFIMEIRCKPSVTVLKLHKVNFDYLE